MLPGTGMHTCIILQYVIAAGCLHQDSRFLNVYAYIPFSLQVSVLYVATVCSLFIVSAFCAWLSTRCNDIFGTNATDTFIAKQFARPMEKKY